MDPFDQRPARRGPGDNFLDDDALLLPAERNELAVRAAHKLDAPEARAELRRLLEWFYFERERQSSNRLEMAMDADFYDGLQWDPEDAQALRDRGQMPLVFNEVAPMVDWLIGTERRSRVDWHVLPRTEDDVQMADVKTKVMKWIHDNNRIGFNRSRAFADAVKVGVGWVDSGARDDPSQDILYEKYEDWRNVLWDSMSYELDLSDARYVFRWRWVDEDIALMIAPDRQDAIRQATIDEQFHHDTSQEEDTWYTLNDIQQQRSGHLYASGSGRITDARRRRVRLIECQYRKPARVTMVADGPMKGSIFNPSLDPALAQALARAGGAPLVDKVMMRVHFALFTEAAMLKMGPSPFRHNRFTLTPIWCYRRGRDRMPYGVVRRVRDIQMDMNKRASKALFLLNSNQIIADEGATDDWNVLRDEADRPDGMIIKRSGKELLIRRDTDAATGQINMMTLDAQAIQKSAGISNENLGRQTNAVSGEAIKARQLQGSVVTTEPFDNLRLATQIEGEKLLSLAEQFYTEEKVVRLTGSKGAIEWVRVNQPEVQADGSVRFMNDVTATMADFVVSEQDYAGTLRQVMFDSLNQLATRLPPEIALRMMTIAMEFSDLPNKDEIASQIRRMTGERDPDKPLTPEEQAQQAQQAQMQAEAIELQRRQAVTALEEQQAKVRELNARAAKLESEAAGVMTAGTPEQDAELRTALDEVRRQGAEEIERLSDALRKTQAELANQTMRIDREANVREQVARIDADARIRVAEIQSASNDKLRALEERLGALSTGREPAMDPAQEQGAGDVASMAESAQPDRS